MKKSPARLRGRPRSEAAHAAILDTAILLIREQGYDDVAMDHIATRAGVGKATVYRRWKSKELLVVEAIDRVVRQIEVPDTGNTAEDLVRAMEHNIGLYRDPATLRLVTGLIAAMARSRPIARAVRTGFVATRREELRIVLERGIARGDLRNDTDVDLAIDLLAGPLTYRALVTGKKLDGLLARSLAGVILVAFGAR